MSVCSNVFLNLFSFVIIQMHELGNPPTEVVGEGNMMMPNLGDFGSMGQVSGFTCRSYNGLC